jgi:hypothetical protein
MQVNSQIAMLCEIRAEVFFKFSQYGEFTYIECAKNALVGFGSEFEFKR